MWLGKEGLGARFQPGEVILCINCITVVALLIPHVVDLLWIPHADRPAPDQWRDLNEG